MLVTQGTHSLVRHAFLFFVAQSVSREGTRTILHIPVRNHDGFEYGDKRRVSTLQKPCIITYFCAVLCQIAYTYIFDVYLSNGDFVVRVAPGSLSLTCTNNGWNRKSNCARIFFVTNLIFNLSA